MMVPVQQQESIEEDTPFCAAPADTLAASGFLDRMVLMLGAPLSKLFHTHNDEDDKWELARSILRPQEPASGDSGEITSQSVTTTPSEEGMTDLIDTFDEQEAIEGQQLAS
jgi:hypothetical protein